MWVRPGAHDQGGAVDAGAEIIADADDEASLQSIQEGRADVVNDGREEDDEASLQSIQEALKSALADGFEKVEISGIDVIKGILEYVQQFREHTDDMTLARQLHRLHSMYFSRPGRWKYSDPVETMYRRLARKVNHVASGKLWPEGSWLSDHFMPNPSWLAQEAGDVMGMDAPTYRHTLRQLGYAPLSAPTKDALDQIWLALYSSTAASALQTTDTERYAVVSYVQVAGGKEPPATWTAEVDSVLTALAEMEIITEKAVWFDKLASRQYKDSQKWWGAAATMQFLFNPVVVLLPRLSEQQAFVASVGNTLWGSDEADRIFRSSVQHAKQCTYCRASYTLRWALEQDFVLPVASLRTWPRVEHALGASGFGLFTSETTYVALAALLTCTFAMFGTLFKNDQNLLKLLMPENILPSTHVGEDASIMIGWVHVSCSDWHAPNAGQDQDLAALKEIASCMNELHHLFCKLQTPKHLASQRTAWSANVGGPQYESKKCKACGGLFYPITEPDWEDKVDVPTLAQYNSNDRFELHSDYRYVSRSLFAIVQLYWALSNMSRNSRIYVPGEEPSISNGQFLTARREALTTLVHSKAAEAPCYAWDDKVVAAILLSSPKVFLDAVKHWGDGHSLADLTTSLRNAGVLAETEDVLWEPNTLIATLAMANRRHTVHRLLPRPEGAWRKRCAHVRPLIACTGAGAGRTAHKCFAGYFLGHLPLRTLDALHFRTPAGSHLPRLNDWVYRGLQTVSLRDSNIVVIRHAIAGAAPSQYIDPDKLQAQQISCWHCQKLLGAGLETPGATRAPNELFWPAICPPDDPSLQGVIWGLGCYDPLNLGILFDPNYYFGLQPDAVAVLLEHVGTKRNMLHAHALAHFSILGSAVQACSTCYGIIVEEHDPHWGLWTILPMDCSKFNEGFVVI